MKEHTCVNNALQIRSSSYYLYPRSSIHKTPLRLSNSVGIIDSGYRGNIIACVDNLSDQEFIINKGERLFQLCHPSLSPMTLNITNDLSSTVRGTAGLGSTGN